MFFSVDNNTAMVFSVSMKLTDYLTKTNTPLPVFAERIGVSKESARRYRNGERIPERDVMVSIYYATSGKVSPNDFYGLPVKRYPVQPIEARQ